jgi:hypothetical protein
MHRLGLLYLSKKIKSQNFNHHTTKPGEKNRTKVEFQLVGSTKARINKALDPMQV